MIGYVLLVVFALIMGTIVYNVVKTYVPKNVIECPDSVSIFITDLIYTEDFKLNITITNNGLFNIAGYFIRATNSSNQKIATKDLSEFLVGGGARELNNVVIFLGEDNPMKPNDKQTQRFDLDENIYSIEIIPVRFQEENNKDKFVSCGGSKIKETVSINTESSETCTDGDTRLCLLQNGVCSNSEQTCIEETWPGCIYSEIIGYEITESSCSDILDNDCDGNIDIEDTDCASPCNTDSICDENEDCSCSDCEEKKDGCEEGSMCQESTCVIGIPSTVTDCSDYCIYLGGYSDGECRLNEQKCVGEGDIWESDGDDECSSLTNFCCCVP